MFTSVIYLRIYLRKHQLCTDLAGDWRFTASFRFKRIPSNKKDAVPFDINEPQFLLILPSQEFLCLQFISLFISNNLLFVEKYRLIKHGKEMGRVNLIGFICAAA